MFVKKNIHNTLTHLAYTTNAKNVIYQTIIHGLAGVLQCDCGKLGEAEDFKCVFIVNCVLE